MSPLTDQDIERIATAVAAKLLKLSPLAAEERPEWERKLHYDRVARAFNADIAAGGKGRLCGSISRKNKEKRP